MAYTTEPLSPRPKYDIAELLVAGVTGLMLSLAALFLCVMPFAANLSGGRDFVVFWATGQQLVHHANPYDGDAIVKIEHSAGLSFPEGAMFMRNPPWGLPLTYPLGLIGMRTGALLWSLALLASLIISVRLLWRLHGRPRSYLHWLGISFAPALICLVMGQTSLFALLGYVLFLDLHQEHPFLAGASLWLCALKPQLFLTFGVVLLAWILFSKSYKILAGAAAAMAASCAAVYFIDPAAWIDYARMLRATGAVTAHIPCLSVALRLWLSPRMIGLTWLPAILGCAWGLAYFWPRRHAWDWMKHGNLLTLVSLLTAPYAWVYDEALAIPALLHGAFLTRFRYLPVLLAFASVLVEAELIGGAKLSSAFYLWTAPTWLAWYLCATGIKRALAAGERSEAVGTAN
jgi:hypothetical protein